MKRLLLFFSISLLAGCASSPTVTVPENSLTPILTHTGGETLGDHTALYWYTSQQNRPVRLGDYVMTGDQGHYQSDYRWREGQLRELQREGEQLDEQQLKPFSLTVRYDTQGRAVFQRYTLGDERIPLTNTQLYELTQDAQRGVDVVKAQRRADRALVQGYWQQGAFYPCSNTGTQSADAVRVSFSPALPAHLREQFEPIQQQGYMAVVGDMKRQSLTAQQLLMFNTTQPRCLTAPTLLKG
ncbi:DUF1481 domain-containing protein [Photobacterium aphoticum]|uniref:Peptidyl-prolyl cis-trans isomerase n=1 Tax=Photobacterium aphoticum TaxID=754436 RepID=A0A0J1GM16_9GAMM|nr:DUF1481 domain-containing protein [Photobacterium aphoticum]KLV00661.1 hypothetical protein ABT58_11850 [Photobacterium aphoticum]PSU54563.1 DUF1481 domain-containing protein [Photobacterium aphoticum]GHA58659.1 peptidyl-prolyl cis-trans isomerase [Photobacterium aphoticum]